MMITPMQKLKPIFKNFELTLSILDRVELTERLPRTVSKFLSYHTTLIQGVKSDFIRIYKFDKDISIAFAFNNIHLDESSHFIIVSAYLSDNKKMYKRFEVNEVREKLKSFYKLNPKFDLEKFVDFFELDTSNGTESELNSLINIFRQENVADFDLLHKKKLTLKKSESTLNDDIKIIEEQISQLRDKLYTEHDIHARRSRIYNLKESISKIIYKYNDSVLKEYYQNKLFGKLPQKFVNVTSFVNSVKEKFLK